MTAFNRAWGLVKIDFSLRCWVCDHYEYENEKYGEGWREEGLPLYEVHRDSPVNPETGRCEEHEYEDPMSICYNCGEYIEYFKDPDGQYPPWYCDDKEECQEAMYGELEDME